MSVLIGIPCRKYHLESVKRHIEAVQCEYSDAVLEAGGTPVLIPLNNSVDGLELICRQLSGILLTGGEDIHPKHYNEEAHPKLGKVTSHRDAGELAICRIATSLRLPIFGICRGLQVLNVSRNGTLYQDLEDEVGVKHTLYDEDDPNFWSAPAHDITVRTDSNLYNILQRETLSVNSLHHQAVKKLGDGLRVVATATDGTVEAVESEDLAHFALGIQCHPEGLYNKEDRIWLRAFVALVEAAKQYQLARP